VWEARNHIGAGLVDEPGSLVWTELATRDLDTAIGFYRDLFGWDLQTGPNPGGGGGEYTVAMIGEDMVAGLMAMDDTWPADVPASWAVYLSVADAAETTNRAKDLGAQVIVAPMEIPTVGTMAVLQDPTGAVFSILQAEPPSEET
jgi:predicted enzyme related to lactoylglutathione lyase